MVNLYYKHGFSNLYYTVKLVHNDQPKESEITTVNQWLSCIKTEFNRKSFFLIGKQVTLIDRLRLYTGYHYDKFYCSCFIHLKVH